ncbi:MAG: 4Fe-4S binding protein [Coriobacteriia bacterium]|nr:4Fe-4S binding protein [Coriobacteriia bacterium]MBN2839467.1 4Fe-4S binding protein [Coriobacteriia bacterium]
MCEFCVQHGDGKKWYLQAENYAADLTSDVARREFVVDFVTGFDRRMRRNIPLLKVVCAAPGPVRSAFTAITRPRQMADHFGQPVPIEECERIFDIATSITQLPCVCRHFAGTPERGYCLGVTVTPQDDLFAEAFRDYAGGPDTSAFQRLTREQGMAVLARAEDEGLMHSVWTFKSPFIAAICNCNLASGCMAMKSTLTLGYQTMWKGEYLARVDEGACVGCGACVERCPFDALTLDPRRVAVVDAAACYGCGICRSACPADALELEDRVAIT